MSALRLLSGRQISEASIESATSLKARKKIERNFFKLEALNGALNFHLPAATDPETRINTREPVDFLYGHAVCKRK